MTDRYQVSIANNAYYVYDALWQTQLTSRRFSDYNLIVKVIEQMNTWENEEKSF